MPTYMIAGLPYSTELYHHGIKGQRWGHKNGPPYPLKANAHSKSEQKAGWRDSLKKNNTKGLGMVDPTLVIDAAMILSTIGLYAVSKIRRNKAIKAVKESLDKRVDLKTYEEKRPQSNEKATKYFEERESSNANIKNGIKMKKRTYSEEEDLEAVNPEYGSYLKASNNCALCSATYDLRRRGYDVTAGFTAENNGVSMGNVVSWYKNAKREPISGDYVAASVDRIPPMGQRGAVSAIEKISQNYGTRGILAITWGNYGGGHAMNYQVGKDGSLKILDPQSNTIFNADDARNLLSNTNSITIIRTDNCEPDFEMMRKDGVFR